MDWRRFSVLRGWRRRSRRRRGVVVFAVLILAVSGVMGTTEGPRRLEIDFEPNGSIRWDRGEQPVLVVWPGRGDGWISLANRYCGGSSASRLIDAANPRIKQPMRDRAVAIPLACLKPDLRAAAIQHLFPADNRVEGGWHHWVLDPFGENEESWEWLAELFTGSAGNAASLRSANQEMASNPPQRGRPLLIPTAQLRAEFRDQPPVAIPTPIPRTTTSTTAADVPLDFGIDEAGAYAVYRLQKGEALYSSVVVRFTGQVYATQVNATALEVARRSGISDVTEIPIGYPIKIPVDLLLPKYRPFDDPTRLAWEQEQRELADFLEVVKATDLSGVHVVIDAGHGGVDTGAVVDGLWEAVYVYDVACRIKANLERHTRATVWMTREDASTGFDIPGRDLLAQDRDQFLRTRPRYDLADSVLGVHLRWYLANDIILNRLDSEVPRSKTVFISVHADSLHPGIRGAMVYVPSRALRPRKYTVKRKDIKQYSEYRNHPTVRFGSEFKARVEASSLHLAENIVASLSNNGIAVHADDPVRDRVLRGRRSWVPAVLRYTAAQNAVLVECCNMANASDRALLVHREWREEFARGVVEGVAEAFNGSS